MTNMETVITKSGGWRPEEVELLNTEVQRAERDNLPLRIVFDSVAQKTGRKSGSVRNFYYANRGNLLKAGIINGRRPALPFTPFDHSEVEHLLRTVLGAQAQGVSVRRCTLEMGRGDRSAMLRYQNKYRSLVKTHPALVKEVIRKMRQEGLACYDPYDQPVKMKGDPVLDEGAALLVGMRQDLEKVPGLHADQFLDGLMTLASAAVGKTSRRKIMELDRISVKYDLLLLRTEKLEQENLQLREALASYSKSLKQANKENSVLSQRIEVLKEKTLPVFTLARQLVKENSAAMEMFQPLAEAEKMIAEP
jgi:hypothetical protein